MIPLNPSIFKAYDIRGLYGTDITPQISYLIGRAYARVIQPQPTSVAVGRDVRTHGESLLPALIAGLQDEGIEVTDIGVIPTDVLYFAVGEYGFGGGITISASHNPREYNGFKMVRSGAVPISGDTGIQDIRACVEEMIREDLLIPNSFEGRIADAVIPDLREAYIDKLLRIVPIKTHSESPRFKIAFNANHGPAGEMVKEIIKRHNLPVEIVPHLMEVNGEFPQGRPDPMYAENRDSFSKTITDAEAHVGIAWDADADRCFFFDHEGNCVDGYHTAALLTDMMLASCTDDNVCIIHDPRLTWAVQEMALKHRARAIESRVGHSFIKERMRKENAFFAGENSGHYYFRDYYYADNGMIPFLLLLRRMLAERVVLKDLVEPLRNKFPISGEINLTVKDVEGALQAVRLYYHDAEHADTDGISIEYTDWRANIRASNTEPILRVNLEAKTSELVSRKTAEIISVLKPYCR